MREDEPQTKHPRSVFRVNFDNKPIVVEELDQDGVSYVIVLDPHSVLG